MEGGCLSGNICTLERQQAHKLARQCAGHHAQPLSMSQRHIAHWNAGEGAAHTRRKANETDLGSALRIAQLRRNIHADNRLRH